MKAAQINAYGGPSVIEINDIDTPEVGKGQILVAVHDASLNPFDTKLRTGILKEMMPLQFPATLGGDIAGIVTRVSQGVTNVAIGDKVYGQANVVSGNSGAFAEYAAMAATQVAKVPAGLDFEQTASLPLVGVSALQAIKHHIDIQQGQKIFIHGGAGGIGAAAIQIAHHRGAYVATTATDNATTYAKELGADEVIDYKTQDFTQLLSGYDAVFDMVGGDDFSKSFTILKKGGIAVSMVSQPDAVRAAELNITAMMQMTHVTTAALNDLTALVETGVVTPHIGEVFPLAQIRDAFEAFEAGKIRGKVIIQVR